MFAWPHAPPHHFHDAGTYFITGSTLHKQHIYTSPEKLNALQTILFTNAREHDCSLQAWTLFANHYHLVVSTQDGASLHHMLRRIHTEAAIDVNRRDGAKGRRVWFQYRDTQLTHESSWLARLRYTHDNAVHHGLVHLATEYRWCSASWFERTASSAFVKVVLRMKVDRVTVYDDY